MSGFLDGMAAASAARVAEALQRESFADLESRARGTPPPPQLALSAAGFDVIAEIKLRSPAAGVLGSASDDWLGRAATYARVGAAAVSVLTEPSRFDGSLEHLAAAAARLSPLGVPVMRKDFLVDPYQVLEARVAGAGGVLVIVRMVPPDALVRLLATAAAHGLFVLLEAFDAADLTLAAQLLRDAAATPGSVLVGVNCRDLQTLAVDPARFAALQDALPPGWPAVAESGVASGEEARRVAALGYRLALVGTALMGSADPATLLSGILRAARTGAQPT